MDDLTTRRINADAKALGAASEKISTAVGSVPDLPALTAELEKMLPAGSSDCYFMVGTLLGFCSARLHRMGAPEEFHATLLADVREFYEESDFRMWFVKNHWFDLPWMRPDPTHEHDPGCPHNPTVLERRQLLGQVGRLLHAAFVEIVMILGGDNRITPDRITARATEVCGFMMKVFGMSLVSLVD